MRILFATVFATLLCAAPAGAAEQHFAAKANGQIEFSMPSGNIGCLFTPKGGTGTYMPEGGGPELSCDRISPSYVNVRLGPAGKAVLNEHPAEQGCCGADNIFAYGNVAKVGSFICTSDPTGLTCETADHRHGFCVAKSRMLHY